MVWWKTKEQARLKCPFCGAELPKPAGKPAPGEGDYTKYACSCKAVYGFDPSGSHMGEMLMELLVFAAEDDWDRAMGLDEGTDYEILYLDGYKNEQHRVSPAHTRPQLGMGGFVFIKIIDDGKPVPDFNGA